jgi:predicted ArsR family transcriptional regulator
VAGDDGTIRLRNCPFHALASAHRDLTCGMNLSLTRGIVDGLGATGYEPEMEPRPGWCCVVLRPSEGPSDEPAASP